jgi:hypothetical protein
MHSDNQLLAGSAVQPCHVSAAHAIVMRDGKSGKPDKIWRIAPVCSAPEWSHSQRSCLVDERYVN